MTDEKFYGKSIPELREEEYARQTARKTTEEELKRMQGEPLSARKIQLQDQLLENEIAVSFEVQLSKVEKQIKEADMRVMENINHIIHLNTDREPDVSDHCQSSALFFQKQLETLTLTREMILKQIVLREKRKLDSERHFKETHDIQKQKEESV